MDEMDSAVKQEENIEPAEAIKPDSLRWYEGHISLEDAKTFIKANITTAARSFIAIGFYLKCVRDRNLFLEEDYPDVWEFARSEYGISKSTASRYMSMNDRFSEGGNSPNIRDEYRAFGKSQLQEMLYLEDDQLEQVKPGDRVEDIRNMRKPKEVPYIELPGQMEFEMDFPEILPQEQLAPPMISPKQTFEMDVEDLLAGEDQESIASSQQVNGDDGSIPCDSCRHELGLDGGSDCDTCSDFDGFERKQELEEASEPDYPGFYNPDDDSLVDESYSLANIPRASDRHVTMLARLFVQRNAKKLIYGGVFYGISDERIIEMLKLSYGYGSKEPLIIDNDVEVAVCEGLIEFYRGDEDLGVCLFKKFTNYVRKQIDEYISQEAEAQRMKQDLADSESEEPGGAQESPETVIDGEYTEIQEETEEPEYTPRYFLGEQSRKLDDYSQLSAEDRAESAIRLMETRQKTIVAALASMVANLEKPEPDPVESEQPELPILKNNDQRKEFIDAYETWPIWIDQKETGERYYRYNLSEKIAIVVKVSWKRAWLDYKTFKGYEYGAEHYYLLGVGTEWKSGKNVYTEDDTRSFYECSSNMSALVEYLKEFQKKK